MKFCPLLVVMIFSVACSSIQIPPSKKVQDLDSSKQLKRTCLYLLSPSYQQVKL